MIETIVNLRPHEFWPKREMHYPDAEAQSDRMLAALPSRGPHQADFGRRGPQEPDQRSHDARPGKLRPRDATNGAGAHPSIRKRRRPASHALRHDTSGAQLEAGGKLLRPVTDDEIQTIANQLSPQFAAPLESTPDEVLTTKFAGAVADQLEKLGATKRDADLFKLQPGFFGRLVDNLSDLFDRPPETFFTRLLKQIDVRRHSDWLARIKRLNWELIDEAAALYTREVMATLRQHAELEKLWIAPADSATNDRLAALEKTMRDDFAARLFLWQRTTKGLVNELNTTVDMPGWANIWTQPIINRVNMLATGVRTQVGVKVFGKDLNDIQQVSRQIAEVIKKIPGAADVTPEQVVGKGYVEITIDREKAARYGVSVGDVQDVIETALGGRIITTTVEGRERFPVRLRYARAFREDEESVKNLLISAAAGAGMSDTASRPGSIGGPSPAASATTSTMPTAPSPPSLPGASGAQDRAAQIPLSMVADVRIVEGPSMIKSENGLLRSYVQLNVRDRDMIGFVDDARRAVEEQVKFPPGMYVEWSGEFEHQTHARRTLTIIMPIVLLVIFVLLYVTYHDLADTLLVLLLAVPGAVAGGMLFQYLFGFPFTVAVWVGYIACFGLATQSGVVMLVYLREAIDRRGGLENIASLEEVRAAIMDGAVHRTRPKLLTETTTIVGLAPMLWAHGVGAEIMQPMAAPVLGGLLVSDEIIDLLLPVLFYHVRRWRWKKIHTPDAVRNRAAEEDAALVPA